MSSEIPHPEPSEENQKAKHIDVDALANALEANGYHKEAQALRESEQKYTEQRANKRKPLFEQPETTHQLPHQSTPEQANAQRMDARTARELADRLEQLGRHEEAEPFRQYALQQEQKSSSKEDS